MGYVDFCHLFLFFFFCAFNIYLLRATCHLVAFIAWSVANMQSCSKLPMPTLSGLLDSELFRRLAVFRDRKTWRVRVQHCTASVIPQNNRVNVFHWNSFTLLLNVTGIKFEMVPARPHDISVLSTS